VAEDDADDRLLLEEAMRAGGFREDIRFARSGSEVMDYLQRRGAYAGGEAPRPSLILLDLRMPGMDGFEVLAALGERPRLRPIPTVVLSTSDDAADIERCYELGANSYVVKCFKFDELVERMRGICRYWLTLSSLPDAR